MHGLELIRLDARIELDKRKEYIFNLCFYFK